MSRPARSWTGAAKKLAELDPALAAVIVAAGPPAKREPFGDPFVALARAISFQQLSGKAASTIWSRVVASMDEQVTPGRVLDAGPERLRACGLSGAKTASLLDLATASTDGRVDLAGLDDQSDDEIVAELVSVRGIGRWTAEMFLMFELGRLDVWPVDDLGVRKGYALMHALPEMPAPKALGPLGDPYRPYRSVAAWYCWRAVDTLTP